MILGYLPFLIYDTYVTSVEMEFYKLHMEDFAYNANEFECIIPQYDPYDSHARKYLSTSLIIQCGEPHLYLTYLDSDGFIHLNKTTIKSNGHKDRDYECQYSEIFRANKSDNKFSLGAAQTFKETEKIQSSAFVLVRCFFERVKLVYETGHAYVPPLSAELYKGTRRQSDGDINHPSVLIFGLDSMSRLNFIRQLPKTYHFLTSVLDAIVFKGMTKTGDNTFPNMMALLSGINVHKRNNKTHDLSTIRPTYFDDIPLVWDSFRDSGYVTMYNEDSPSMTFFNLVASGFEDPPTDYYVRPFWLAMNSINNFNSKDSRCYGNTPKHLYLLDYIEQFAARMKNHRYFAFTFLTLLSHDDLNEVQVADSDFEKMFLKIQRKGQLNNTIVIVLGDHGHRFSELRKTDIGRVEERMPFLAVSLPRDFKHRYPHLVAGLEQNQNKLLSWYVCGRTTSLQTCSLNSYRLKKQQI
jgi:hypothetical protein